MAKLEQREWISSQRTVLPSVVSPHLTICIINWNCSDYLCGLLESIRCDESDLPAEVIVVDNASTDNSVSMVESKFPEVHLIRNDRHHGVAHANNQAAARARGELLLFLNNDTIVWPGALRKLVDFFDQHPELSAVGPSLVLPDGKLQANVRMELGFRALLHRVTFLRWTGIFRGADRKYRRCDFDLKQSGCVDLLVGAALLVRREQFMSIGGWDEGFEFHMDDVDLSSRLSRFGKMYHLAEAQITHWGGLATKLDEAYAYRCREESFVYFIRKHCGVSAARVYKVLISIDMPVRVFVLALTCLAKRLTGQHGRAARDYQKLAAASQFLLHHLSRYWRS